MKVVFQLLVAFCVLNIALGSELVPKQLAGPPSEFDSHKLPQPFAGALVEQSALFRANYVQFVKQHALTSDQRTVWEQDLLVDSAEKFVFSFFALNSDNLQLSLVDPKGQQIDLNAHAVQDHFPVGYFAVPGTSYVFDKPTVGQWKLTVSHTTQMNLHEFVQAVNKARNTNQLYDAVILLWNQSPLKIYSRLNTYNLQAGQEVGLVTTVTDDSEFSELYGARASLNISSISVAQMELFTPLGKELDINMKDDGLTQDGFANDGTYGALIKAQEVGDYEFQAVIRGKRSDGVEFVRTTQHIISVTSNDLDLVGTATASMKTNRMNINLAITVPPNFPHLDPKFRAYAEVWGKDKNGNDVPVCWVSSISQLVAPFSTITLELDLKWLALAQASAPLTLKNVYVQDAYTMIPVAEASEISVTADHSAVLGAVNSLGSVTEITLEMKQGVAPAHIARLSNLTAASGNVVLIHGYCAGSNPWAANPHQWTDAHYFDNPKSNLPNQAFAEKVASFINSKNLQKYSLIGHSQGGMVSLHLLNYYFTAMDVASNGRKVQSVGTPYTGCSAAGSAANLGKAFGVGCGDNFDLTRDGSKLWLSGITAEAKKSVYYYTTTYKQGNLFGDYCNMAINLVLQWPNDGTTELDYAQLAGANNMGNKQQWCHTTDMKYPAQYNDAARNSEMNANAAR